LKEKKSNETKQSRCGTHDQNAGIAVVGSVARSAVLRMGTSAEIVVHFLDSSRLCAVFCSGMVFVGGVGRDNRLNFFAFSSLCKRGQTDLLSCGEGRKMAKEELKRYKRLWARKKRAMGGPVPVSRWQRVVGQYLPLIKVRNSSRG
jgi:hypothetical protein